jgi:hypothetical protein
MKVANDIRRLGFRRWYERQLIESHAYLVAAFFGLIMLLSGIEVLDFARRSPVFYLLAVVVAAAAGTGMFIAWKRFTVLLGRAEQFASSAECPSCHVWGKFSVLAAEVEAVDDPPEAGRPRWMRVKCSKCGTDWKLG